MISLGSRCPLEQPLVSLNTKVFNRNVCDSGRVNFWLEGVMSEPLDLNAEKRFKILAFDGSIVNSGPPANREASRWYEITKSQHRSAFLTDAWIDANAGTAKCIGWMDELVNGASKKASKRFVSVYPKHGR